MENNNWLDEYKQLYLKNEQNILSNTMISDLSGNSTSDDQFPPLLPIAMKISAKTIAMGGPTKSKEQRLREDRLNKIRQIEGKEPNVKLPDDAFEDGLVSVKPMSAPNCNLMYMDFRYGDEVKKKTLSTILKQKILNILEMLKKNI